ncbi:hypothetical protein HUU59_10115 [bacterium]|nr:hypothetical protein [bacterium]
MISRRLISGLLLSLIAALWIAGCQSPEAQAQKLFAERKYQEVINKYPDSQVARRARAMMAEDLLEAGKYQEVIEKYPDTRAALLAHEEKARSLFNEKKFDELIAQFPNSPLANDAKNILAENLYNQGRFDELVAQYPKTPKGKEVLEARAKAEFDAAKKMKGDKQIQALEAIMRQYVETAAYKEAANLLREVRKK